MNKIRKKVIRKDKTVGVLRKSERTWRSAYAMNFIPMIINILTGIMYFIL